MAEFRMPSLGADMDEGTLQEWLVKPGDTVHKGDIVAVVDTAKAAVEVECFSSGTIGEILVVEGATVPVGTPLATIETAVDGREMPAKTAPPPAISEAPTRRAEPTPTEHRATPLVRRLAEAAGLDLSTVHSTAPGGRITRSDVEQAIAAKNRSSQVTETPAIAIPPVAPPGHPIRPAETVTRQHVSAYARRLANELHIDLSGIHGTGRDGAIRAQDIRAAARKPEPTPAVVNPEPVAVAKRDQSAMRTAIAELMSRSKREIPHYYLSTSIDVHVAMEWLREHNRRAPVEERIVFAALLLKATALAAQHVPELNGHWVDGRFVPGQGVQLGNAVSLRGGGLIAPTIADAENSALPDLMARMRELTSRARSGRLRTSEMAVGTLTVTNLGDLGAESVFGVIYPPQVALVGFGAIRERPWAVDGMLAVRPIVTATLAADHRASDGATGARFLNAIADLLAHPEEL